MKETTGGFDLRKYAPMIVILLPLIVFISSVNLGLTYFDDDILIIQNQSKLSDLSNLGKAFRSDAFFENLSPYYRPMMNVSFMFDTLIGQGKIPAYHLFNVIYHVLVCLLLYRFLLLLGISVSSSLATVMIFSIHPVMGNAVYWIPARGDLLVTMFALLSMITFLNFVRTRRYYWIPLQILAFTAAMFSKESAIALPILFLLLAIFPAKKLTNRELMLFLVLWIGIISFWYTMRYVTMDHRIDSQRGISPMLQNLPFLPESLTRLALPFFLPVTPVFTPLITFLGICIAAGLAFLLFYRRNHWIPSLVFIGIIWFLIFSAPNMFVRLASARDNFEYLLHRMYLPSVGLLIMATGLISSEFLIQVKKRTGLIFLSVLIILIISNFHQKQKYRNAETFWTSSIAYAPERSWFYYQYGRYYFKQKEIEKYEKLVLKADSLSSYPNFHYQLAMIYFSEYKDYDKAYRYFMSALRQKGYGEEKAARTNFVLFCIESSYDLFKKNKISEAIERCQLGLNTDPSNATAAYNLGIYHVTMGNKKEAVRFWELAIKNDPELSDPYKSLAIYYLFDEKDTNRAKIFNKKYETLSGQKGVPGL